ncbi:HAD family hydrolase [Bacilliculturomica massiliensis]|uniref:HAD family hydrolase n=1 Tax=Bacilliculturomica massiliensis TaxID=1917867 RepID=UPI0010311A9A|nr:HAD family phosphatase [Bacilliculturomica massiliensis]
MQNFSQELRGAIFDMDGTLLDSMSIWNDMGANYLLSRGVKPRPDLLEALRPLSLRQAAEYLTAHYDVDQTEEEIMEAVNSSIEHFYREEAQLKPGVLEMLERWKTAGVRMCVATATDRYLAEAALSRTGALAYFEKVFTCTELETGKDRPDIFLTALDYLGTDKESTWVFEDALFAAQTVKGEGIPLAVIRDASSEDQREELLALADVYIENWAELPGFMADPEIL